MLSLAYSMCAIAMIKKIWTQLLHADNRDSLSSLYIHKMQISLSWQFGQSIQWERYLTILRKTIGGYLDSVPSLAFNTIKN